jgi:hypothetical protein
MASTSGVASAGADGPHDIRTSALAMMSEVNFRFMQPPYGLTCRGVGYNKLINFYQKIILKAARAVF